MTSTISNLILADIVVDRALEDPTTSSETVWAAIENRMMAEQAVLSDDEVWTNEQLKADILEVLDGNLELLNPNELHLYRIPEHTHPVLELAGLDIRSQVEEAARQKLLSTGRASFTGRTLPPHEQITLTYKSH